ncbi:thiamine diphosphokinase [Bacillus sp. FJAT-47783]|uniref:thiamine diphosphokinase n=1 Tax=Bacillus sp. FJAT-47783 TaxID=2922712 RepID=UPI001FADE468|nr:thiamine diphosphokinase [Bacillus sp. FJAT-47783]
MNVYHIVAGGPIANIPNLKQYDHRDVRWIGVDRGVLYLLESGIIPDFAFGDFDSISEKERQRLNEMLTNINIFPSEKDKTDSEIGIDFALSQKNVHEIVLFGATGGRLDHLFGNVHLLFKALKKGAMAKIIDCQNEVSIYQSGTYTIEEQERYRYISYLPFSEEVTGLTLQGFKYPLINCHIKRGSTLCISNELIHSVGTFSFENGILMMIRSCDEKKSVSVSKGR